MTFTKTLFISFMNNEHLYATLLLSIANCICTVALIQTKSLVNSIIYAAFFSVNICLIYLMLDAPDVAMTEAAIGACLTTLILLESVKKLHEHVNYNKYSFLTLILTTVLAYLMINAGTDIPNYGSAGSPLNAGLPSQHYIKLTQKEVGIDSAVAAILASYRGFDTLGETLVIVMAGLIVTLILDTKVESTSSTKSISNLIIETTFIAVLPLMLYFVLFIQINGEASPGGGFQAGAILASILVGLMMINNRIANIVIFKKSSLTFFAALGVLIYAAVGIITMFDDANFLDYYALNDNLHKAQFIGIFIVELGVGMSVTSTLILIYKQFAQTS